MREIIPTTQFRRDTKRARKQGRDVNELRRLARRLAGGETLEPRYRDHPLKGEWSEFRECHVHPDWLLIYRRTETELVLARIGTHADLFGT
jgi:mRNA interferase YafQ